VDKQAQGFTWLHLTDLHIGGRLDDTYWPTVKAELWQDLHNPPVEELRAPDIVFFTGDLSFSGRKHQFDDVARFLDELRHRIGAVPIVAVPGNHDLTRPQETERARFLWLRFLADAFCEPEQARLWAERSPLRDALTDLFEPYTAFAQHSIIEPLQQMNATVVQGVLPGDLSVSLSIRDLRLGIVGLNSTWRQFAGGDFERCVTVHPRQLHAVLHTDKKNKRPFGATPAAPLQPTWCRRGGAG
jgi:Calcineurin-like phosphoesterase